MKYIIFLISIILSLSVPLFSQDLKSMDNKTLISLLTTNDLKVKELAWKTLIKRGRAAVEDLINAVEDPKNPSRAKAIGILGEIKDRRALDILFTTINEADPNIRVWSVRAIGKIRDERGIPYLVKALNDKDRLVRTSASYYLSKFGKNANQFLIEASEKGDEMTKTLAQKALVEMAKKQSIKYNKIANNNTNEGLVNNLIKKLGNTEPTQRENAETEIKKLGYSALKPILKNLPTITSKNIRDILVQLIDEINQNRGVKRFDNLSSKNITLLGIAKGKNGNKAIVEDSMMKNYILTEGSILGKLNGVVTEIENNCITINEFQYENKTNKLCITNKELVKPSVK